MIQSVTNDANGKFSFEEIQFTGSDLDKDENGNYITTTKEYTIREKKENLPGIKYDETEYKFVVTLTDDGNGKINVTSTQDLAKFNFVNTYETSGKVTFSGEKTLNGKELKEGTFTFELVDSEGNVIQSVTNDANGKFSFEEIQFTGSDLEKDESGNYKETTKEYTIREKKENLPGVKYDETEYKFVVTLADEGQGKITVTSDKNIAGFKFVNTYETSGEAIISVLKELIGRNWNTNDVFEFTITSEEGNPLPDKTTIYINKNSTDYKSSFGKILFTKAGTYRYIISETHKGETINGIKYDSEDKAVTIKLEDNGEGQLIPSYEEGTNEFKVTFTNQYYAHVSIKKVDLTDGKEVEGATIQLLDSKGAIVEQWRSTKETHVVEGLKTGEEYTLKETLAPDGYKITKDIKFVIDENEKVITTGSTTTDENGETIILIEDEKTSVRISKVDLADGEPIEGAKIQVIDAEGNIIEAWTSTKEVHIIEGLKTGVEYTLKETEAPDGYKITMDITFVIDEEGKVTTSGSITTDENGETIIIIEDEKTSVRISKVDLADGKELEGATIQVLDSKGNVVEEWTSTKKVHIVEGLKTGEEYTLKETLAPAGYKITEDITFVIDEEGKVTTTGSITTNENGETIILVENYLDSIPSFEKKIIDTNDTTGATSDWQDSADYDIGDEVPFKLSATLAKNVTSYTKYFITFNDNMEKGLTFNKILKVLLNNEIVNDYEFSSDDHSFVLSLSWGDGKNRITDENLNEALVEVLFTSILNENAVIGSHGNINKANLEYSNNPKVITDKEKTEDDFVIVFTYKVEINKTNENNEALSGAMFKLEKVLADGTRKEVESNINANGNTFTFVGLDDGQYVLTETETPIGYLPIDEIVFTVTADHEVLFEDMNNRDLVLTKLSGNVTSGEITLEADKTKGLITSDIKNIPKTTKVTVKKVWDDNDNQDGLRPQEITVKLSNGDTVVLSVGNGWKATIENLPEYKDGEKISYTWTEENLPKGYTLKSSVVDGEITTITNTHIPEKTKVTVIKVWDDNDNQDGLRPQEITVKLSNGEKVVLNEGNGWKATIEGLPVYKDGEKIGYTWTEENLPKGYTLKSTVVDGEITTLTNTHTPEITKVTVIKVWDDADNQDGLRPQEITVKLSNGDTVVLNEGNNWKATIENLPVFKDGKKISYTWTEENLPKGYTLKSSVVDGEVTTLTNTHTPNIIAVLKVDITTKEEVPGANIQILDSKGNIVDEWISTKDAHIVKGLKANEEYTLKETVAPEGYKITTDSKFTIDEEGKVTTTGNTTTDQNGNIVILVEDEKTKVMITKVDITTGKELPGATIQIIDSKGNVIEEWVSTTKTHIIEGLKTGEEYTLKETVAPEGYDIASVTKFTINEKGIVTTTGKTTKDNKGNTVILIEDEPTGEVLSKKKRNPKTADYYDLYSMLLNMFVLGFGGSIIYIRKLKES